MPKESRLACNLYEEKLKGGRKTEGRRQKVEKDRRRNAQSVPILPSAFYLLPSLRGLTWPGVWASLKRHREFDGSTRSRHRIRSRFYRCSNRSRYVESGRCGR